MEKAVGKNDKLESFKLEVQNEIGKIEVGKSEPKLETSMRSWKVKGEVGRFELKLESSA